MLVSSSDRARIRAVELVCNKIETEMKIDWHPSDVVRRDTRVWAQIWGKTVFIGNFTIKYVSECVYMCVYVRIYIYE